LHWGEAMDGGGRSRAGEVELSERMGMTGGVLASVAGGEGVDTPSGFVPGWAKAESGAGPIWSPPRPFILFFISFHFLF
jgi:hypothetical protein